MNREIKGRFKPGEGGRPLGAKNKYTTVKETVLAVFLELQKDPKHDLVAFAKSNKKDFYIIASKLIPTEIAGSVAVTATITGMEIT